MARFAKSCRDKFNNIVVQMSAQLGPDTADLQLRVGQHSGAVTAGVLRGNRSRFQLFGDTVNTAARMESTGLPNKIQVSRETAALLEASGKSHWLSARDSLVAAKGKGTLQTYFIENNTASPSKDSSSCSAGDILREQGQIDWTVEVLHSVAKQMSIFKMRESTTKDQAEAPESIGYAQSVSSDNFESNSATGKLREQIRKFTKAISSMHHSK
jgi:Adenylate and Guanylate cyclase catalytic domain